MEESMQAESGLMLSRALLGGDPELFDIADELAFDMHSLKRFAVHLLDNSGCKMSGDVFLASLSPEDYTTIPGMARALLKYWYVSRGN